MAEYIDRKDAIKAIDKALSRLLVSPIGKDVIGKIPAADVAEVVRCGQCKEWEPGTIDDRDNFNPPMCKWIGSVRRANDFCSYGERKETQAKTCGTCKHFPPDNEWPCVDCDMSIHDRWED